MKYFWFSGSQKRIAIEMCESNGEKFIPCFVKTDKGYTEFTEVTSKNKPSGNWNNYVLILESDDPSVYYGSAPNIKA